MNTRIIVVSLLLLVLVNSLSFIAIRYHFDPMVETPDLSQDVVKTTHSGLKDYRVHGDLIYLLTSENNFDYNLTVLTADGLARNNAQLQNVSGIVQILATSDQGIHLLVTEMISSTEDESHIRIYFYDTEADLVSTTKYSIYTLFTELDTSSEYFLSILNFGSSDQYLVVKVAKVVPSASSPSHLYFLCRVDNAKLVIDYTHLSDLDNYDLDLIGQEGVDDLLLQGSITFWVSPEINLYRVKILSECTTADFCLPTRSDILVLNRNRDWSNLTIQELQSGNSVDLNASLSTGAININNAYPTGMYFIDYEIEFRALELSLFLVDNSDFLEGYSFRMHNSSIIDQIVHSIRRSGSLLVMSYSGNTFQGFSEGLFIIQQAFKPTPLTLSPPPFIVLNILLLVLSVSFYYYNWSNKHSTSRPDNLEYPEN